MIKNFKDKRQVFFGFLFIISILPFFGIFFNSEANKKIENELFNPKLASLNSIEKVISYTDSVYFTKFKQSFDTSLYVEIVSETVKNRFSYGLMHYSFSENWIAYLSGKIFWAHLSAIVNPDDILKHSEGLCSQQTIVFMEVLRRKGINVRTVGLGKIEGPGHFLCEVHYNNSWRLHDVTKEPEWGKIARHHESMNYYLSNKDSLFTVYAYRMSKQEFDEITHDVKYGKTNEFPAKNMLLFHQLTKLVTYLIPAIFIILFLIALKKQKGL